MKVLLKVLSEVFGVGLKVALVAAVLVAATQVASAATVTIHCDAVGVDLDRISVEFADPVGDEFDTWDATANRNTHTLLDTSYDTFVNAFEAALGPLGFGELYQINSAKIIAGTGADNTTSYKGTGTVHRMTTEYVPSGVTWTNPATGGNWGGGGSPADFSSADYDGTVLSTGVLKGAAAGETDPSTDTLGYTEFAFDASLVQGWIDAGEADALVFTPGGSAFWRCYTHNEYVEWEIDVVKTNQFTVTVSPDNVNRVNELAPDTVDGAWFSTRQQDGANVQYTILTAEKATLLAALAARMPDAPGGYTIISATLTVGAEVTGVYDDAGNNEYYVEAKAHQMTTSYDPGDVTWNNSDESESTTWNGAGGTIDEVGDLDWDATVIDTGVASDTGGTADNDTVTWSNLGPTVQSWIDGDAFPGLFFEDQGNPEGGSPRHQAVAAAVEWTIVAERRAVGTAILIK